MSSEIGTYSFLPWLRQGLANQLQAASTSAGGASRATIQVALELQGDGLDGTTLTETIQRDVPLYGPGDIVGLDRRAIIKTEPRTWITNFEPNYLPYVEFYDEDLPWRYTPEVPSNHRLRPWIMLVVLKESEFEEGARTADRPTPYIVVSGADAVFPPIDQLWGWAHVHVNRDLGGADEEIVSGDMNAVLPKFEALLRQDPDLAYSRIMSPRKLDAGSTYHAFLIPTFETGRLAGLGHDPAGTPSVNHGAWQPDAGKTEADFFPYYYRWTFMTGTQGDFEYLVRLLEPRPIDSRVGQRDIDVQVPGSNLTGITDPEVAGVLRLGGALRVPERNLDSEEKAEFRKYDQWDQANYPHPFQADLAAFVNLSDDYSEKTVSNAHTDTSYDASIPDPDNPGERKLDPDPLITPPLYGRWHAMISRLLFERDASDVSPNDNWVHQLNLDPRYRVAANFGTEVIQRNQEAYMTAAWEQIGDVLEANRWIRLAQLAKHVGRRWYARYLLPLHQDVRTWERSLAIVMPVRRRVVSDGFTVHHQFSQGLVPAAILSTEARRIMRPRGRLMQALPFDEEHTPTNLVTRINRGDVTANPDKPELEGAPTLDDLGDALEPAEKPPPIIAYLLERMPWSQWILLALIVLILLVLLLFQPTGWLAILLLAVGLLLVWLFRLLRKWKDLLAPSEGVREENQTPDAVDRLPKSPDFRLIEPGDPFRPARGLRDSTEASNYKQALREAYTLFGASRQVGEAVRPQRTPMDLPRVAGAMVAALDPAKTIPRHTYNGIIIPPRIRDQIGERFVEAMAYPEIDLPMYKPLVDESEENFLPNIRFIEQNTISLLETNQAFIEAYMVGLNHEFARELLWREYVTDQRGSPFRQFWDVSGYLDDAGDDAKALREKLKDIPPIHTWRKSSKLKDHDHREADADSEEEAVLVIRGELLKRYPTAVIYAHRAKWQRNQDGTINQQLPRLLDDPEVAEGSNPPRTKVKTALYEAKVEPDIYFFGFDLTVEKAVGGTGENEQDDPGWFFVIKERPGEPRFGLDIDAATLPIHVWNQLGWGNVVPNTQPGDFIGIDHTTTTIQLVDPPATAAPETQAQSAEDKNVRWHKDTHAAELAYILYQVPVMVAVHAAEMLPQDQDSE